MAEMLIEIFDNKNRVFSDTFSGLVELGRQAEGEKTLFKRYPDEDGRRIVFARKEEQSISRHHFTAEPLVDGRVRIENKSKDILDTVNDFHIKKNESRELALPVK